MVVFKRKKVVKYRGSKTHGGGSMKKRRGAGSRGGRGNAGSGKRGDAKKPSFWKNYPHKPNKGFKPKNRVIVNSINVYALEKLARQHGNKLDLQALGFDKLLGAGSTNLSLTISVPVASAKAVEKIKKAKGTVTITRQEKPAKEETPEVVGLVAGGDE